MLVFQRFPQGFTIDFSNSTAPITGQTKVTGKIILDQNNNCITNGIDIPLSNQILTIDSGKYYAITDATGAYKFFFSTGTIIFHISQTLQF
ncbi:MAG: hypothetical protein IPP29_04825 [Bacteroidetes bacterium]|nr:hypothetical protein [Bacteroidota bacterium]